MKKNWPLVLIWAILPFFALAQNAKDVVQATLDLNNILEDKVTVNILPPKINADKITYYIPKIIPGTYSEDDYGQFIDNFKAFDKKGNELKIAKLDENSWSITDAKKLAKITYRVNDTYDIEDKHDIFSPAGTNIEVGKNFVINQHGFIGYFENLKEIPYEIEIIKPTTLYAGTALVDIDKSAEKDMFKVARYADLVDSPIQYTTTPPVTFLVEDMEVMISVHSPSGSVTASMLQPEMERMMKAQKKFLGKINNTKKYAILLYMSDTQKNDAEGFGALEHNTSTTVVFPEMMPKDQLIEAMIDVVSHEFFHIVTPLSVHSKEIHYFDFNTPKMSKHLWMYEGITEYFANLFQVNQGLITDEQFYDRIATKIANAKRYDDKLPFTKMSANVLTKPNKENYMNVYEKGTLIAMCIDIIIREKSNGERGILDLMQKLSVNYGSSKPFDDEELFDKITEFTYPEVRKFLDVHVAGPNPINYDVYFSKMGVTKGKKQVPGNAFLKGQMPYITVNPETKEISVVPGLELNTFMTTLGIKAGDIILAINDTAYNLDNIYDMIMGSMQWKENDPISVKIKRDGKEQTLKGITKLPMDEVEGLFMSDTSKQPLNQAWLKG